MPNYAKSLIAYQCRNIRCRNYPYVFNVTAEALDQIKRLSESVLCPACSRPHVMPQEDLLRLGETPILRFIGDVHGNYNDYLELTREAAASIQVGDLGLDYSELRKKWAAAPPPGEHRAIAGNHDNYDPDSPEYFLRQDCMLEDFGATYADTLGFYVRGGFSIDHMHRNKDRLTGPVTWWDAEELPEEQCERAFDAYVETKPLFVVSHECPLSIVPFVANARFVRSLGYDTPIIPTRTNQLLQRMLEAHKPKLWVFGHFHRRWFGLIDGVRFHCLDMIRGKHEENRRNAVLDVPLAAFDDPEKFPFEGD